MNVLFLCTGNSARSILGEAILNRLGDGQIQAFSAGSHPTGTVNRNALDLLQQNSFPTEELRSKSWIEFSTPDSPVMDYVITVCSNAAGETCPVWPGDPIAEHWDLADPAGVEGTPTEIGLAFLAAYRDIEKRIIALVGEISRNREETKL